MTPLNRRAGDGDRNRPSRFGRRDVLAGVGAGLLWGFAGCSGPSFPDADVIAGPGAQNRFEPAELTVSVGETVIWGFASAGHNVCCRPDDHDSIELPDDAEPFSSYGPAESPEGSLVPRGESYEQTLDVTGIYYYVCIPHASVGMQGTIRVE